LLQECGIAHIGIAGHPEGHNAVAADVLWEALAAKQALASSTGMSMHIVTQFGFDGGAFPRWQRELAPRRIQLPVRIGIAGPASLAKLMHFALQCGIGAALRTAARKAGAAAQAAERAMSPDQHLLTLLRAPVPAQIVAPHFFAFGGALRTAQWMRRIATGEFDIDAGARRLVIRGVRPVRQD
jgi:methylenetetrahydrofolate reductase (NADPH)